jgi:hypothetical protein
MPKIKLIITAAQIIAVVFTGHAFAATAGNEQTQILKLSRA